MSHRVDPTHPCGKLSTLKVPQDLWETWDNFADVRGYWENEEWEGGGVGSSNGGAKKRSECSFDLCVCVCACNVHVHMYESVRICVHVYICVCMHARMVTLCHAWDMLPEALRWFPHSSAGPELGRQSSQRPIFVPRLKARVDT